MDPERIAALANALGHPERVRFLSNLATAVELSPRAFSERTGVPLGTASYHVRVLRGAGLIEQTRSEPKRGAVEHVYALTESGRAALAWARKAPG